MRSDLTRNSFLKGSEIIKHVPPRKATKQQTILGESWQIARIVLCEPFQTKKLVVSTYILSSYFSPSDFIQYPSPSFPRENLGYGDGSIFKSTPTIIQDTYKREEIKMLPTFPVLK